MDYNVITYHFDDIENFYKELDELQQTCLAAQSAQYITTQYVQFLNRFQKDFVNTTTILSHILQVHALSSTDSLPPVIAYSLLLYAGKEDSRWMQYVVSEATSRKRNQLLGKILNELDFSSVDHLEMGVTLSLGFEMGKVTRFHQLDLDAISIDKLTLLLDLVDSTRLDTEEFINEQFMMSPNRPHLMIEVMANRPGSTTFGENLPFMLDRSDDSCVQLLILKLVYCIFTEPRLYDYYYTNDLYVLVDIILREFGSLGDDKGSKVLREAYLHIL